MQHRFSNMGMWWGEGQGCREAAALEPKDNLSKPEENNNKKNRLKTLVLIPTRIERAGDTERKEELQGGTGGKGAEACARAHSMSC